MCYATCVWAGLKKLFGHEPTVTIDGAPDGARVRLTGIISADPPIVAPFSRRPCVAYSVRAVLSYGVNDLRSVHEIKDTIVTADEATVKDGSGVALLRLRTDRLDVDHRTPADMGWWFERDDDIDAALASLDLQMPVLDERRPRNIEYTEQAVVSGAKVVVEGFGRWESLPDDRAASYREVGRRLMVDAGDDELVVRGFRAK